MQPTSSTTAAARVTEVGLRKKPVLTGRGFVQNSTHGTSRLLVFCNVEFGRNYPDVADYRAPIGTHLSLLTAALNGTRPLELIRGSHADISPLHGQRTFSW